LRLRLADAPPCVGELVYWSVNGRLLQATARRGGETEIVPEVTRPWVSVVHFASSQTRTVEWAASPNEQGRDRRMAHFNGVVGIDVAKEKLDLCVLDGQPPRTLANAPDGHREVIAWLKSCGVQMAVMEASGGYERVIAGALRRAGFEVRIVDPKRVRHFARAAGRLAKNDRIDARIIAEFGAVFAVAARHEIVPDTQRERLAGLLGARQALVEQHTALRNQISASLEAAAKRVLAAAAKPIAGAIKKLDRLIAALLAAHPPFAALAARLDTVPGLGPVAIAAIIAWLPELGRFDRRALAALVGVAPFDDDSGRRTGQRYIQGGRCKLRNILYMAAMGGATRHNPLLKAHYTAMIARGKLPKVAIIACLRKLLTILNTMLAQNKDWDPEHHHAALAAATA
jgi:transposase